MQDGSLVEKDLWIDERRGVVLDSQVSYAKMACAKEYLSHLMSLYYLHSKRSSPSSGQKES
jgi:hypothetical protein